MKNNKRRQNNSILPYIYSPVTICRDSIASVVKLQGISGYMEGLNYSVMSNVINSLTPSILLTCLDTGEGVIIMSQPTKLQSQSQGIGQKPTKEESLRMAELKAAQEKAAQEKAAQEKAAQEKAAQEKALIPIEEQVKNAIEFITINWNKTDKINELKSNFELLTIYLPVYRENLQEDFRNTELFTNKLILNNNFNNYFLYVTNKIESSYLCKNASILPASKTTLRFECSLCNSSYSGMVIEQKYSLKNHNYNYKKWFNETSVTAGNRNSQVYIGKELESSTVEENLIIAYRAIIPFFKKMEKVRQGETDKEFKKADSKLIEKWEKEITSFITKKANRLNIELI